jgi:hypothetical protein
MALNFPTNPSVGDKYTIGDVTWQWNGTAWVKLGTQTSLTITETLLVTTITNSVSTNTGGLRVVGGVGIGKDVTVGGSITVNGGITANSTSTIKTLVISGTTESISPTTGALKVAGGAGVGGNLWVGGVLHMAGGYVLSTTTLVESLSSGVDISVVNVGASAVRIDCTSTLASVTGRGSITPNAIQITNSAQTNNTTSGALQVIGGIGVGKNVYSGGNIYAVGTITGGFSDRKLKTDITPITDAVAKVSQLNGITYIANDTAQSLGFATGSRKAGLFADEVQKVLPEVTFPIPGHADYLNVNYSEIVPLLVEAIKELKAEIETLKSSGCCSCKN